MARSVDADVKKQAAQERCTAERLKWLAQMVRKNAVKPDRSDIDYRARLDELEEWLKHSPQGE